MQFEIRNRFTDAVHFTAEIDCAADAPISAKIGLAVKWAVGTNADLRKADLRGADLRGADLCGADLCGADLRGADLRKADLREADLCGADLRGADLRGANLCEADLRGADLREAPAIEDIHAKVYAAASQPGALDMSMWHCGTSHCRAGWVVTLAGKEGADLEAKIGTSAAAMAIYMASDPERWKTERLPDFYCNNASALADMARMAGVDGVADLTDTAGR
jgi:uncharacterized protein YjbI with pentapeptide repeats